MCVALCCCVCIVRVWMCCVVCAVCVFCVRRHAAAERFNSSSLLHQQRDSSDQSHCKLIRSDTHSRCRGWCLRSHAQTHAGPPRSPGRKGIAQPIAVSASRSTAARVRAASRSEQQRAAQQPQKGLQKLQNQQLSSSKCSHGPPCPPGAGARRRCRAGTWPLHRPLPP